MIFRMSRLVMNASSDHAVVHRLKCSLLVEIDRFSFRALLARFSAMFLVPIPIVHHSAPCATTARNTSRILHLSIQFPFLLLFFPSLFRQIFCEFLRVFWKVFLFWFKLSHESALVRCYYNAGVCKTHHNPPTPTLKTTVGLPSTIRRFLILRIQRISSNNQRLRRHSCLCGNGRTLKVQHPVRLACFSGLTRNCVCAALFFGGESGVDGVQVGGWSGCCCWFGG